MEFINTIFNTISGLGKYLMVPLMVALIGICFKANVNKAIKGGITVGIGLFGLDLALSLVSKYLGPVASALVDMANLHLDVIDVGWTALSGVAYATEVGAFIIPFCVLLNIVLLAIGATKTMDIDIWNYWHYALTGSLIYLISGNIVLGFLAATAHAVVVFAFGDRFAELTQKVIGIPGISLPHGGNVFTYAVGAIMEKVYNFVESKIGSKKKEESEISVEKVNKVVNNPVVAIMKDPIYTGFILGTLLAFIAKQDAKSAFTTGMAMAALLYLTPRMVKILMEGLLPISNACKAMMSKKYKGEQLYIGMDTAVALGHPTIMLGTVLLIPVAIILCAILPGNRIIPMASLAACGYNCCIPCIAHKGKFWRMMLTTTIVMSIYLVCSSAMAPKITEVAVSTGFGWEQTNFTLISSISGDLAVCLPMSKAFELNTFVGVALCVVIIVGTVLIQRRYFKNKRELNTREFVSAEKSDYAK